MRSRGTARIVVASALVALLIVLGTLQGIASLLLRERAQRGAWMTLVPSRSARALVALGSKLPLPLTLLLVAAREALGAGDVPGAIAGTRRLMPSPDRSALLAGLARLRGDTEAALRDDMAGGDDGAFERDLMDLAAHGQLVRALELQRDDVARLQIDPTALDPLAEAQYHLGIFEEARAQTYPAGTPQRRAHESAAAEAYAHAVALGPLDERYLLAAANQALNMSDWQTAARTFARAQELDPAGADPVAGLGDLALRRGDPVAAQAYLARARALDATSVAVARLARKLGR